MAEREPGRGDDEPRSFEEWLARFGSDATLRPVLVVAIGCFTAIGAGALLVAVRGHNLAAIAALCLLALGTADLFQRDLRRHRFGPASRLAAVLWLLSAAAAVAAVATGLG